MADRLLDTNIVSYIVNGHTLARTYQPHLSGYDWSVSFQTAGELYEGGVLAGWGPARGTRLHAFLSTVAVLDGTADVATYWAEVRAARRARPIGVADAWIAATALAHGLELVTHNPADFAGIPGLVVVTAVP